MATTRKKLLDDADFEFDLLTTSELDKHPKANKTHYISNWKLNKLPRLISVCKQYKLVHIQYPAVGYKRNIGINLLPFFLRLMTKSKIIVTLHEYHGSGILGRSRNLITTFFAHEIVISNDMDKSALPRILSNKSQIIPIGSNINVAKRNREFYDSILNKAAFTRDKPVYAFFGFAFQNKGLELAIAAAETLVDKMQLLLLTELRSENSYHQELLNLIDAASSRGADIYVTGFLPDNEVSEVLQECDYFLLPQPLPLTAKSGTAITAANHGMTIVSTQAENAELNKPYVNQINSILINPINKETLTKTLSDIQKVDQNEISKLAEYFSWGSIIEKHKQLYGSLLK